MYDTVKGSDWLGDQDAIEFLVREAPKLVYELEHFGMPFDRTRTARFTSGVRRPFAEFGERPVQRSCCAADRTGHAMLHTLYQRNVRARTQFFVEWMALDLIRDASGQVLGVTALEMETGEVMILHAARRFSRPVGRGAFFPPRPMRSSAPATAWAWRRAPVSRWKTWSSGSFTRRVSRRRGADHRRRARRGRLSAQQRRGAIHGGYART